MFLSELSIRQPVLTTMMAVSLVTLGVFSYRQLPVDLFPDVEIPVVTVQTLYPGASPETVEREVTKRIEEALNTISGVRHIQSTTTEGLSMVVIEFRLGVKIHTAQQDAQAKLNAIRSEFPEDMKEPVIQRIDFNAMPVISLAVESTTADAKTLSSIGEKVIKKRLEMVSGVGQVNMVGLARREIQIFVDRQKLESLGVTYAQVANAMRRENMDVPAGKLEQGNTEPLVRVTGKFKSVDGFRNLIIDHKNGRPIFLPEVARIVDGIEERRSASVIDDREGLALECVKQSGSNTVEVADNILKAVTQLNTELPSHIRLRPVIDRSTFIRHSVEDVQTTLVLGGFLTVLIVFLFLNSWRSTIITGLALPVSVIAAFTIMSGLNFTLNILTLMGLSLAIGLLIDDAIVVRENIVRHMHQGANHMTAAREATSEIGMAVMSTTFSIIAVFVPVAFMGGIIGRFFYQFGITVGFAVLVSLFVSFTIDPMLSSRWYDPAADPRVPRKWFGRWLDGLNRQVNRLQSVVAVSLDWSLRHRWAVVLLGIAAVGSSLVLFGKLGSAFMPEADSGQISVTYKAEPGVSLARSVEIARQVTKEIRAEHGVAYTYAAIGANGSKPISEGAIYVRLTERETRPHFLVVMANVRERLRRFRAIRTTVGPFNENGAGQRPIEISVRGADLDRVAVISSKLMEEARTVQGAADVDSSEEAPRPELRIQLDRRVAGDLGLDLGTVASTVRGLVAGEVVSQFEDPDGDSYDVRLRVDPAERTYGSDLLGLNLPGQMGRAVIPLRQVAHFENGAAPSKIRRWDLMREVRVGASTQGRSLGEVVNDIKARTATMNLPPGYNITFAGDAEQMVESFGYVSQSLILAIILIYAILASQFRSFTQPLAIMLSLPLSLLGVAGMMYLVKDSLNIMSMIGLILLMGLVTKNAILVVDFANNQRRAGMTRHDALISAAKVRLRPILMTTLAMIFGMLPLAFELGAGAEFRAPMARAVIGGLITSTILTLLVVPIVYTFLDDSGRAVARWWAHKPQQPCSETVKTPSMIS